MRASLSALAMLASVGLAALPAGAAAPAAEIPFNTLSVAQRAIATLPPDQRTKLRARVRVIDKEGGPPLQATAATGGRQISIPIDSEGVLRLPSSPEFAAENPAVRFNRPKGSLGLEVGVSVVAPAGSDAPISYYRTALSAAQAALASGAREKAGLLSVFAKPKVTGLGFRFALCCGRIEISGTSKTFDSRKGEALTVATADIMDSRAQRVRIVGELTDIVPAIR